jgi:hypothetical protein
MASMSLPIGDIFSGGKLVINIDPNVVYGILVAIVLIVLIASVPSILRSRYPKDTELLRDPMTQPTETWPHQGE